MRVLADIYWLVHNTLFGVLRHLDGLPSLAMRFFLAPVFWMAGTNKLELAELEVYWFGGDGFTLAYFPQPSEGIVDWFDKGLGLPQPELMAYLASYTEALGAVLLLLGLATRWISIPLMVTMAVAAVTVHVENGWAAIASSADPEVSARLERAKDILREHGNYGWLTARGNFVILNNGIEFAATYFIMLLALFFTGGGRYVSADYWLAKLCQPQQYDD